LSQTNILFGYVINPKEDSDYTTQAILLKTRPGTQKIKIYAHKKKATVI
jgi:hypothetical protein